MSTLKLILQGSGQIIGHGSRIHSLGYMCHYYRVIPTTSPWSQWRLHPEMPLFGTNVWLIWICATSPKCTSMLIGFQKLHFRRKSVVSVNLERRRSFRWLESSNIPYSLVKLYTPTLSENSHRHIRIGIHTSAHLWMTTSGIYILPSSIGAVSSMMHSTFWQIDLVEWRLRILTYNRHTNQFPYFILTVRKNIRPWNIILGDGKPGDLVTTSYSPSYTPEHTSIAERVNRTMEEAAISPLIKADLPECLWTYALKHAIYIQNRAQHSTTGATPISLFTGKAPDLKDVKLFACCAYFLKLPKPSKFEERAKEVI